MSVFVHFFFVTLVVVVKVYTFALVKEVIYLPSLFLC